MDSPRIPARPRSTTGSMPCNSKPDCDITRTARPKHQVQATSGRSTSARPTTRPSGRETPRRGRNRLGDKVRRIDRDARQERSTTAEKQHRVPSPGGGGQTSPHSKLREDWEVVDRHPQTPLRNSTTPGETRPQRPKSDNDKARRPERDARSERAAPLRNSETLRQEVVADIHLLEMR